jgi:dCTP deaminase
MTGGFWSSEKLRDRLSGVVIDGKPARVKYGAYELSMGKEYFVTTEKTKKSLRWDEQMTVPPGQMALLLTEEVITVPKDAIAFIAIKSKYKLSGLVNVSGFHVDPGFVGSLVFSVYNAGPNEVPISRGEPVFLIWFCSLDQPTEHLYHGAHEGQFSISDSLVKGLQGTISSPASLQQQMNELRVQLNHTKWFGAFTGVVLGAVFSGILVPLASWAIDKTKSGSVSLPPVLSFITALSVILFTLVIILIGKRLITAQTLKR